MDDLMQMVAICQEFGWTYQEYMSQPAHFLTLIKEKMKRDNKEHERSLKKLKHG